MDRSILLGSGAALLVGVGLSGLCLGDSVTYDAGTFPAVTDIAPAVTVDTLPFTTVGPNSYSFNNTVALTQKVILPKFDTSLGNLTKVTLTLTGDGTSSLALRALTGSAATTGITVATNKMSLAPKIVLQDSGSNLTHNGLSATQANPQFSLNFTNGAPIVLSNGSQQAMSGSFLLQQDISQYTSASVLNSFKIDGFGDTKVLDVTAFLSYSVEWTGAAQARVSRSTSFGVTAEVTYEYNVVPEAGTMLLGGCAVMPLLGYRRRAKKA